MSRAKTVFFGGGGGTIQFFSSDLKGHSIISGLESRREV